MKLNLAVTATLLLATAGRTQSPASPSFEVATIKPSAPLDNNALRAGTAHIGTKIDAARVDIGTASLFRLICTAWRARPYQVSGPDWLKTAYFDIEARIPAGVTADKVPEMLQALLVERFGLKVHLANKDQSVYALIIAKGGPKLKISVAGTARSASTDSPSAQPTMTMPTLQGNVRLVRSAQGGALEMPDGEIVGKVLVTMDRSNGSQPGKLHLESLGTSMKTFAELLSVGVMDRAVVDETGLTGNYDVAADLTELDLLTVARTNVAFANVGGGGDSPSAGNPNTNMPDPVGSSIFASVEKLGLKLEPSKLPLEMLIVDHIDKSPREN